MQFKLALGTIFYGYNMIAPSLPLLIFKFFSKVFFFIISLIKKKKLLVHHPRISYNKII